eukprot:3763799-Amphidinium_carterae.1
MWRGIAVQYIVGCNCILHTDSAKAYNLGIEGLPSKKVPKTSVVHQPKKINGHWAQPHYTGVVEVDIGADEKVLVQKGT